MIYVQTKKAVHTWNHDLFVWGWVGAGMRAIAEGLFENIWHTFSKVKSPGRWNHSGELLRDWCSCSFANCRLSNSYPSVVEVNRRSMILTGPVRRMRPIHAVRLVCFRNNLVREWTLPLINVDSPNCRLDSPTY